MTISDERILKLAEDIGAFETAGPDIYFFEPGELLELARAIEREVSAPSEKAERIKELENQKPLRWGVSRSEWHDQAWALFHEKTLKDGALYKVNIHTIRAVLDATYDAIGVPANAELIDTIQDLQETLASVISSTAKELGCEADNESILETIFLHNKQLAAATASLASKDALIEQCKEALNEWVLSSLLEPSVSVCARSTGEALAAIDAYKKGEK
jgi:hypothetical protein